MTREVTLQTEAGRVWIIESPTLPAGNNRRPISKVFIFGVVAAFLLIAALISLLEFIDPTVRIPSEAAELADVPVIGVIPRLANPS